MVFVVRSFVFPILGNAGAEVTQPVFSETSEIYTIQNHSFAQDFHKSLWQHPLCSLEILRDAENWGFGEVRLSLLPRTSALDGPLLLVITIENDCGDCGFPIEAGAVLKVVHSFQESLPSFNVTMRKPIACGAHVPVLVSMKDVTTWPRSLLVSLTSAGYRELAFVEAEKPSRSTASGAIEPMTGTFLRVLTVGVTIACAWVFHLMTCLSLVLRSATKVA